MFKRLIPGPRDFLWYVYNLRWHVLVIIVLFTVFAAAGFIVAQTYPSFTDNTISGFKEEVSPLKELSPINLALGIFENNAVKCFLVVVLGIVGGIAPVVFTIANGFVIGIVIGATMAKTSVLYVIVGIVPHGVIEMPMVFISAAIGLKLGIDVIRTAIREKTNLWNDFAEALFIFVFWIAPLLFISAFVETFVTGALLYMLFPH